MLETAKKYLRSELKDVMNQSACLFLPVSLFDQNMNDKHYPGHYTVRQMADKNSKINQTHYREGKVLATFIPWAKTFGWFITGCANVTFPLKAFIQHQRETLNSYLRVQ